MIQVELFSKSIVVGQTEKKYLELTNVKQCLSVVNGVHYALKISYLRLSLYVNKIKDKAIWQQ